MGLPLLLPLLLLMPGPMQAGSSAGSKSKNGYEMEQPEHLSAPEGGSVHIPFSFYHPGKLAKDRPVRIFWRWEDFHGKFIYNTSPPFIHEYFKNRLVLNWKQGLENGSLQILNLQRKDQSTYFCRVQLYTLENGKQQWQALYGTTLNIAQARTTTLSPTTVTATTTDRLSVDNGQPSSLSLGAVVGLALAGVVLVTMILGLAVYFRWRKNTGLRTEVRTSVRGSIQNSEGTYENIGHKGHTDPKLDPKDDGIVYASLALSSSTSSAKYLHQPPHKSPQDMTLYSTLKA